MASKIMKVVLNAKDDLLTSGIYSSIVASFREGLKKLNEAKIEEMVCFGLGHVSYCIAAYYQLAFLLCLRDLYTVEVIVYDPLFDDDDCKILRNFGIKILDHNSEGKYKIKDSNTTLFYLPHCCKELTNNLLWSNWGLQVNRCIIVSNSFSEIFEKKTKNDILKNAKYIYNCKSRFIELPIINNFKFCHVFNDTSIHIFPLENLRLVPEDIWSDNLEPSYLAKNIVFITKDEIRGFYRK